MVAIRLRDPRQLRLIFTATMAVLLVTLGCLTWWLLNQDAALARQSLDRQREIASDQAVAALDQRLAAIERQLGEVLTADDSVIVEAPGPGAVFVRWSPGAVRAWPADGLPYYPDVPSSFSPPSNNLFTAADDLELRALDYRGAIAALSPLAASPDAALRAHALVRIARSYLKARDDRRALQTYLRLGAVGAVRVSGIPAALAGPLGMLAVHERRGDVEGIKQTAAALHRELRSSRWMVSTTTYAFITETLSRVGVAPESGQDPRLALADAVEQLWARQQDGTAGRGGRLSVDTPGGPVAVVWRSQGGTTAAFAADAAFVRAEWMEGIPVGVTLVDPRSQIIAGPQPVSGVALSTRPAQATGLPWTVHSAGTPADEAALGRRRVLLVSSLTVVFLLVVIGASFIGRSVARELAVSRLQSDFVATVSHELRTPLTALCQLSELLMRGRVASDEDRSAYYAHLYGESDRLRRLVEGLLDFGRFEAGRTEFQFEPVDASALVRQSAAEFAEAQPGRHRLEVEHAPTPFVRADREALRCALWNLFENAIKYSPDADVVRVEVARRGRNVEIAVADRGVGIPRAEQRRIFDRFVRGSAAQTHGIRGTGIGLAMVRQIVRAHGGRITVESEPGQGSTFRMLLPVERSA